MIIQKKILGIVGIRSGSTGLKNKNIKILGDKPLVGWILSAAKKSKFAVIRYLDEYESRFLIDSNSFTSYLG